MSKANLACVFLASGFSTRFCGNKLEADFNGEQLYKQVLNKHAAELFVQTAVVTRYPKIALCAAERGFTVCENTCADDDIAKTIALGIAALRSGLDGCMFCTCDMPLFSHESCEKLVSVFAENKQNIVAAAENGERRSPVIFPAKFFSELSSLPCNTGGNYVIKAHPKALLTVNLPLNELKDIDTKADLDYLQNLSRT